MTAMLVDKNKSVSLIWKLNLFNARPALPTRCKPRIHQLKDLSEISRGEEGGLETERGSQLFETAGKGGVMKNEPLKGGGSCKYVSVIM